MIHHIIFITPSFSVNCRDTIIPIVNIVYSLGNKGSATPVSNKQYIFPDLVHKGVPKDATLFDFSLYAHNPQMLKSRSNSTDYYSLEQSELHS